MSATSEISKFVRDGLTAMLSDPTNGFNAQLAAVASQYSIEGFTIDFTGANGNFVMGRVSPDQMEAAGVLPEITDPTNALAYVFMTVDTMLESDTGLTLDSIFGGDVQGVIDLTISWESGNAIHNFANWSDAVLWSVRNCLSNPAYQGNWTSGLIYNRVWSASKGPLQFAGANWRQTITFLPKFKVIAH